ncbi:hypothetical protein SEA_PAVLO_25 [Microbacterium phage Pavlo]|nr:hypothetical protein SEA_PHILLYPHILLY_26 [Microbacterium phage PhillyPhilly]UVG34082.1 hypothetical protein SEA_PAVLO_25 [Microbacterium phage Pavlo]
MTKFDPVFAREVLERRQKAHIVAAGKLMSVKWELIFEGEIHALGARADAFDKEIHKLWREADSYESVLRYLDVRIWDEKTRAEKIWQKMEDCGISPYNPGVQMVEDVLEAAAKVDNPAETF